MIPSNADNSNRLACSAPATLARVGALIAIGVFGGLAGGWSAGRLTEKDFTSLLAEREGAGAVNAQVGAPIAAAPAAPRDWWRLLALKDAGPGPGALAHGADVRTVLSNFAAMEYRLDEVRKGQANVPRVYVATLPRDLPADHAADTRKEAFVAMLLPIILSTNEHIMADRKRLLHAELAQKHGLALSQGDQQWLGELAARYKLRSANIAALKRRVDIVPASLALAQAAEESGWGTSRFAQTGNAIFGERTWGKAGGMRPMGLRHAANPRAQSPNVGKEDFRVRAFDGLKESVVAYMHNLNAGQAYSDFRSRRADLRRLGRPIDGLALAGTLSRYSTRGPAYVAGLKSIIRGNGLSDFDQATLDLGQPSQL